MQGMPCNRLVAKGLPRLVQERVWCTCLGGPCLALRTHSLPDQTGLVPGWNGQAEAFLDLAWDRLLHESMAGSNHMTKQTCRAIPCGLNF